MSGLSIAHIETPIKTYPKNIIVYDGVCKFCNGAVNFILPRDQRAVFVFCAAQSELGTRLMSDAGFTDTGNPLADYQSLLLVQNWGTERAQILQKSDAFFCIASNIGYPYKAAVIFQLLPRRISDRVYDFIAKNRYRWFGRHEVCQLPNAHYQRRFID